MTIHVLADGRAASLDAGETGYSCGTSTSLVEALAVAANISERLDLVTHAIVLARRIGHTHAEVCETIAAALAAADAEEIASEAADAEP